MIDASLAQLVTPKRGAFWWLGEHDTLNVGVQGSSP